ncbi:MAG: DUF3488 and transglutaminase-like domain-containing protein [Planctomycetota bacterium]
MTNRSRSFDLFVLAPLGIAVVAYQLAEPSEVIPPVALIVCVVARALQDTTGWVIGKRAVATAVVIAIGYVIVDIARNRFQVTLFADFMMILAALKSLERRTPRDDGQLLIVSIFVALSAAVSSNRMGTGVLLVLYLFSLMFAVMRVQVDAAVWPFVPDRRGRLWPLLSACIVGTTLVASVAFVLLPRNTMRWAPNQFVPPTQRVSGFRESVELGTGGLISQDPSVVLRVWPESNTAEPAESFQAGAPLYLRGSVLTEYEFETGGGRWSRGGRAPRRPDNEFDVLPGTPVSVDSTKRTDGSSTLRIVQYAGASNAGTVFSPWRPSFITFDQAEGTLLRDGRDLTLRFERPPDGTMEFRVTHGPDADRPTGAQRESLPQPSGSDILREAAFNAVENAGLDPDPITRPVAQDLEAIRALESWLRSSKQYTLDIPPADPGRDPTEWFVESADAGHCEYFASALALLCREVGIRSRVATGYLSVVDVADTESISVRRSDAHAWVEAEIAPGYWQVFDATPAALGQTLSRPIDPITRWLSSLESVWLASFVSFDARAQSSLSNRLQRSFSFERFDTSSEDVSDAARRPWLLVLAGALLLFSATGWVILYSRRRRRSPDRGDLYGVKPGAIRARDELEALWKQDGDPRPAGVTLVNHASTRSKTDSQRAAMIERLAFDTVRES